MAGSQGSAYSDNSGGKGYVLNKTVRLNKGDKLKAVVGTKPSYQQIGDVLHCYGGNYSELYLNDSLVWRAGGGAGTSGPTATASINQVRWYNGYPGGAHVNSTSVHHHSGSSAYGGGCYTIPRYRHDHGSGCWGHVCDGGCYEDLEWVYDDNDEGEDDHGWHRKLVMHHSSNTALVCGNQPANILDHYDLGCGCSDHQIMGSSSASAGTCFITSSGVFASPSASIEQIGNGMFSCKLAVQGDVQSVNNMQIPAITNSQYFGGLTTVAASVPNGSKKLNHNSGDCKLILFDPPSQDISLVVYFRR